MLKSSNTQAAEAIQLLRRQALITETSNTALAKRLGVTRQTVSERFHRGDMRLSEFLQTAHALDLKPEDALAAAEREREEQK